MKRVLFLLLCCAGIYLLLQKTSLDFYERPEMIEVYVFIEEEKQVVSLPFSARMEDLIERIDDEDIVLEKISLQQSLHDGDVIFLTTKKEISQSACISLNFASIEELKTLNGVGTKTAEAIISYRESMGLFSAIEEVMRVKGIGEKKFAKMKDQLCL